MGKTKKIIEKNTFELITFSIKHIVPIGNREYNTSYEEHNKNTKKRKGKGSQ